MIYAPSIRWLRYPFFWLAYADNAPPLSLPPSQCSIITRQQIGLKKLVLLVHHHEALQLGFTRAERSRVPSTEQCWAVSRRPFRILWRVFHNHQFNSRKEVIFWYLFSFLVFFSSSSSHYPSYACMFYLKPYTHYYLFRMLGLDTVQLNENLCFQLHLVLFSRRSKQERHQFSLTWQSREWEDKLLEDPAMKEDEIESDMKSFEKQEVFLKRKKSISVKLIEWLTVKKSIETDSGNVKLALSSLQE